MESYIQATLLHTLAALADVYYMEFISGLSPLAVMLFTLVALRLFSKRMWKEESTGWWVSNGLVIFLLVFISAWTVMINL